MLAVCSGASLQAERVRHTQAPSEAADVQERDTRLHLDGAPCSAREGQRRHLRESRIPVQLSANVSATGQRIRGATHENAATETNPRRLLSMSRQICPSMQTGQSCVCERPVSVQQTLYPIPAATAEWNKQVQQSKRSADGRSSRPSACKQQFLRRFPWPSEPEPLQKVREMSRSTKGCQGTPLAASNAGSARTAAHKPQTKLNDRIEPARRCQQGIGGQEQPLSEVSPSRLVSTRSLD